MKLILSLISSLIVTYSCSPINNQHGYILEDCRFTMREDGTVLMNFLNIPMTTPILQKIGLSMCAKRGPTYGGNEDARIQSFQFAKEFMVKYFID